MKKEEIEQSNKLRLNDYLEKSRILLNTIDEFKAYKSDLNSKRIQNFEELKESLESRLEKVTNKNSFLKSELEAVNKHYDKMKDVTVFENDEYFHRKVFFKSAFEDYIFNSNEPDYSKRKLQIGSLLGLHYGSELGKYKVYLDGLLINSKASKENLEKETSLPKQLLVLHYLGVIDYLKKNSKNAVDVSAILSLITGKSKENIRKEIRIFPPKVPSNKDLVFLNELQQIFAKAELLKEVDLIKKDKNK